MAQLRLRSNRLDWREIDGEVVALERDASVYLASNRTGAMLWKALVEGSTRDALVDCLVERFEIDPETAGTDVDLFLGDLAAHGLLEV